MLKKFIRKVLHLGATQYAATSKTPPPQIIPYFEHGINADALNFAAEKVVKRLQNGGFDAFVVGGAVRDLLLGIEPKDFDIATNAAPEEVRKLFRRSRIIGRRFKIVHVMVGPETIEVTTFRGGVVDQHNEHGRIMKDNTYGTQAEDAMRRDFTCNALYFNPKDETIIDYNHGFADIKAKRLMMIGDPAERYKEDSVRILRAARLSAKLGFTLEVKTAKPIVSHAYLLQQEPPARLFDELLKLLLSGSAKQCLNKIQEFGVPTDVFPLLQAVLGQNHLNPFADIALHNTDMRIRAGKSVSVGFLMAALLWQPVQSKWQFYLEQGQKATPALIAAMNDVQDSLDNRFSIPRRFSATMREIWLLQPQFEVRVGVRPFKILTQARFRAAYDFLLLRIQVGEQTTELGEWWTTFQQVSVQRQQEMIVEVRQHMPPIKRKRRHRKPTAIKIESSNE